MKLNNPAPMKFWKIRRELFILYYAFRDQRTPFYAKLPAAIGLIYLISPIDIIPDFIPFVGYLDDIIIVPLLLNLSVRLLSKDVFESSVIRGNRSHRKMVLVFCLLIALTVILLTWIYLLLTKN